MKKLKWIITIFLVLISFVLFCSKDENKEPEEYRIKKMILGENYQSEFFYGNENLIYVNSYDYHSGALEKDTKDSIEYIDNKIIMTSYYYNEDNDFEEYNRFVYTVNGNQIIDMTFYLMLNNSWKEVWKYEYEYQNGKLLKYEGYREDSETKTELIYQDELLIQSISIESRDGSIDSTNKIIYEYINKNLSIIIEYNYSNGSWIQELKNEYEWNNSRILSITTYDYYDNEWEFALKTEYNYDSNVCLSSSVGISDDGEREEDIYEYEKGKGNFGLFLFPQLTLDKTPMLSKRAKNNLFMNNIFELNGILPYNNIFNQ